MTPQNIKSQLKKLANEFNLKWDIKWFGYLWISKREEILKEYAGACPDPIYEKYGRTAVKRIKDISNFVNSTDFKECVKRYGGQVASKSGLDINNKNYKSIKDQQLRKELLGLNLKIKRGLRKNKYLALITSSKIKKEVESLKTHILRHEWIHILINENNISFRKFGKNYWKYNEGLVTYFENYLDRTLQKLEIKLDEENYPMQRDYFLYGLKFREQLKDCKTSPQRKNKILEIYKKLK